jgi:hypothetical protein
MFKTTRTTLVMAAVAGTLAFGASAAGASTVPVKHALASTPITATTTLTNRPDSGVQGNNWALDNFTRIVTIKLVGTEPVSDCPGTDTGFCYGWKFTIQDTGTAIAQAGQDAPRVGTLDQTLPVSMTGGTTNGMFFSSWKTAKASRVPTSENDNGNVPTGDHTTTNWVEQFFGSSAVFNSQANPGGPNLGSTAGWTYRLNYGADTACPNDSFQWVDAAAGQWGSLNTDGNILTPNTSDCS